MKMDTIETSCVFEVPIMFVRGADLCGIKVEGNGHQIANFLLQGEGIYRLDTPI